MAMRAIITNKNSKKSCEVRAEKIQGAWIIGGDLPDYKNNYYNIIKSDNSEYELKNGFLKRV